MYSSKITEIGYFLLFKTLPAPINIVEASYQVLQFPTFTLSPGPIIFPSYLQGHWATGTQRFLSLSS